DAHEPGYWALPLLVSRSGVPAPSARCQNRYPKPGGRSELSTSRSADRPGHSDAARPSTTTDGLLKQPDRHEAVSVWRWTAADALPRKLGTRITLSTFGELARSPLTTNRSPSGCKSNGRVVGRSLMGCSDHFRGGLARNVLPSTVYETTIR